MKVSTVSVKESDKEQEMLTRASSMYRACYSSDRELDVMKNCIRIAMDELSPEDYLAIIKSCNMYDITLSEYIEGQAKSLLGKK